MNGERTDVTLAAGLITWLREQLIPARVRNALLRDLQLVTGEHDAPGTQPRLRGLDSEMFVRQLHQPDGGEVARVAGIGDRALASLRAAIPPPETAREPADPPDDTLAALAAAAEGLLVPSESDYPLTPVRWEGAGPPTPADILARLGLPPQTPVETRDVEAFFAPLARTADWMDDAQRAQAARFAALRDLITARLPGALAYRAGRIKITVVIAGLDAAGAIVGLQTTLIET